jgi:hypothetical protein
MAYAKTVGKLDLYNLAKRNGVAMRTIAKYMPALNINSGLIGWWKLDEASGTSAYDSSGNAITGTLVNTPAWVAGKINNALNFDKASYRHVTLASNAALAMASGSFTFAAWINPTAFDTDAWHGIIGCASAQGASYGIADSGGTSRRIKLTRVNSVDFATGTQAISTGSWQHVAVVMDRARTSLTYYLNGVADIVAYSTEVFDAGIQSNRIGCRYQSGDQPFDGQIDDVRIYNRALSADDITALYAVTAPNYIDGYAGPRSLERMLASGYGGESDYWGQCITLARSVTITKAKFAVRKIGTPTGNVTAYLFATTGTIGTDAKATGSPLATSGAIAATALPTDNTSPLVEFTFATPYLASAGGICIAIEHSVNEWEKVIIQVDNTSPSHAGNAAYRDGNTQVWTAANTYDLIFEVYGY